MPPDAECACNGDLLQYTCTLVGPGSTVWGGSALDCPDSQNQIVFRHSEFESKRIQTCTDGRVVGQPLTANNDTFISQLNVTVDADGEVECRRTSTLVGRSPINVVSGK